MDVLFKKLCYQVCAPSLPIFWHTGEQPFQPVFLWSHIGQSLCAGMVTISVGVIVLCMSCVRAWGCWGVRVLGVSNYTRELLSLWLFLSSLVGLHSLIPFLECLDITSLVIDLFLGSMCIL